MFISHNIIHIGDKATVVGDKATVVGDKAAQVVYNHWTGLLD